MEKKGQMSAGIWGLVTVGVAFVVIALVLAFGQNIMGDIKGDFTTDSLEYNATIDGQEGLAKVSTKLPLIATVIVAGLIIGILVVSFMGIAKR